jgi:hypothetical protein
VKKRGVNQLLRETAVELAEGEELLAEKKKARKKAKSKLARESDADFYECWSGRRPV